MNNSIITGDRISFCPVRDDTDPVAGTVIGAEADYLVVEVSGTLWSVRRNSAMKMSI